MKYYIILIFKAKKKIKQASIKNYMTPQNS